MTWMVNIRAWTGLSVGKLFRKVEERNMRRTFALRVANLQI